MPYHFELLQPKLTNQNQYKIYFIHTLILNVSVDILLKFTSHKVHHAPNSIIFPIATAFMHVGVNNHKRTGTLFCDMCVGRDFC